MSVQAFLEHQQRVRALAGTVPSCWVIVANSVHSGAEHEEIVVAFDTQALANAYVEASLLPADMPATERHIDNRTRAFRPDSHLWNYNDARGGFQPLRLGQRFVIVVELTNLFIELTGIPQNPSPPFGPLPPEAFARDAARRLGANDETAVLIR